MFLRSLLKAAWVLLVICCIERVQSKPWLEDLFKNDEAIFRIPEVEPRPFYIECATSSECIKNQCCAIGRQRFALPRCMEHSGPGDSCFPEARAVERNVTYPDMARVRLTGVYDLLCPCSYGMYCEPTTHTCMDDSFLNTNLLNQYEDTSMSFV